MIFDQNSRFTSIRRYLQEKGEKCWSRMGTHMINRVGTSAFLQLLESVVRVALNFVVMALVIRHLGPEMYADIAIITTLYLFASIVARLGLPELLANLYARKDIDLDKTTGAVFTLKILAGLISSSIFLLYVYVYYDESLLLIAFIYSASLVTQSLDFSESYLQANVRTERILFSKIFQLLVTTAIKLAAIHAGSGVIVFAMVFVAELALLHFLYFMCYLKGLQRFVIYSPINFVSNYWRHFMPVMIANVVAIASIKIDSLMLYAMVSEVEYGIFSAVLKLSESWYFIPTILALVISPQLVRWKESSDFLYYDYLVKLLVAGAVLSIVIALITGHFSNRILNLLYGYEFSGGGSVLAIYIWCGVAICFNRFFIRHLVLMERQSVLIVKSVLMLILNVVLNFYLIPLYGALGAAYSTLISLVFGEFLVYILVPGFDKERRIVLEVSLKTLGFGWFVKWR